MATRDSVIVGLLEMRGAVELQRFLAAFNRFRQQRLFLALPVHRERSQDALWVSASQFLEAIYFVRNQF